MDLQRPLAAVVGVEEEVEAAEVGVEDHRPWQPEEVPVLERALVLALEAVVEVLKQEPPEEEALTLALQVEEVSLEARLEEVALTAVPLEVSPVELHLLQPYSYSQALLVTHSSYPLALAAVVSLHHLPVQALLLLHSVEAPSAKLAFALA